MSTKEQRGVGWTTFPAIMLIMIHAFRAITSLAGIIDNKYRGCMQAAGTETSGDAYILQFDASSWGWIHLILVSWSSCPASAFSRFRLARTVGCHRGAQRSGRVRVAAVLPDLGDRHHRRCRVRHLGADGARSGHRRE